MLSFMSKIDTEATRRCEKSSSHMKSVAPVKSSSHTKSVAPVTGSSLELFFFWFGRGCRGFSLGFDYVNPFTSDSANSNTDQFSKITN